jgi:hypothetical protein
MLDEILGVDAHAPGSGESPTSEPSFDDEVASEESESAADVMATFGAFSGLDKTGQAEGTWAVKEGRRAGDAGPGRGDEELQAGIGESPTSEPNFDDEGLSEESESAAPVTANFVALSGLDKGLETTTEMRNSKSEMGEMSYPLPLLQPVSRRVEQREQKEQITNSQPMSSRVSAAALPRSG